MKKQPATASLAALMQQCRLERGLSQKAVAEALGYSTAQVVSDWERGVRSPPGPMFRKLIKLYDVDPELFYHSILEERTRLLESKLKKLLGVQGA